MDPNHRAILEDLLRPFNEWEPESILIEVDIYDSATDRFERKTVDLVDIIGRGRGRQAKGEEECRFYLPRDKFNVNTEEFRQQTIVPYIALPCCKAGIELRMKGMMFGGALAGDGTFGTNAEKRVLYQLACKNSRNEVVTIMQYFMPSTARWAYDWLFRVAIPSLFGNNFCAKATTGRQ
jgi:hypothetical protein